MRFVLISLCLALIGCGATTPSGGGAASNASSFTKPSAAKKRAAELNFLVVMRQMEPTIEAECRRRRASRLCDFQIVIDDRAGQKPNAFQTVLEDGTPILGFTEALLYDVRNRDELAFVLGHEAAHHILNHLGRQKVIAEKEAAEFDRLARTVGASPEELKEAQAIGAAVGALSFSQEFEIEADVLGARLTRRAGFDALRGSAYFQRIPDPGNGVLSTHPPNEERVAAVKRALR